jgi:vancomycin resistance protein YoaR
MDEKMIQPRNQKHVLIRILRAIPLSLAVFLVIAVVLLITFDIVYADRIFPGVHMLDVDLSGMTREEASEHLAEALAFTYEGQLAFTYQDQVWEARPIDLGYLMDPASSAQNALDVGRDGWLPTNLIEKGRAWFSGVGLSPRVYYDQRMALNFFQTIAGSIDQPVREASLSLEGTDVVVVPGRVGREVDIIAMLSLVDTALTYMQSVELPLVVKETQPVIADVGAQAELAREMLSAPLIINDPDPESGEGPWTISPSDLAPMLMIMHDEDVSEENSAYQITLNNDLFSVYLNGLAPGLQVRPVNARFIFNDDTRLLDLEEPAVIGRKLDVEGSIERINEELKDGKHEIALVFETIEPSVTDDTTGEEIGITELVHQETSYFYGSDSARVQNIRTASAQFHGLLVPPGATFSMADALGNISLENGYAEALIIYGDQTIQGVGGGVCQVSTTLFRATFFAGFPITERHAHAYRVGYYEMRSNGNKDPNLAGLDATVYVPIVDFKFVNDTDHWLLMETYMGNYSLTWKFYSTSDGRTVNWETTGPTDVVPAPEPRYKENPDLDKGEIKQVDYAADGANIYVTRTVYKGDQIYFSDSFYTQFRPWQAVYEYGPGTEIPGSDKD